MAALVQGAQRMLHRQLHAVLAADVADVAAVGPGVVSPGVVGPGVEAPTASLPFAMRMMRRFPALQVVPAWATAIGPLPEHAPPWARRRAAPVPTRPAGTPPGDNRSRSA